MAPFATPAQQKPARVPRIALLIGGGDSKTQFDALKEGLRELGYEDGKSIVVELRSAGGRYEQLPQMATELVKSGVDILITGGTPATRAAHQATKTIPIVMSGVGDPIGSGLIASLARPGGNVTGTTNTSPEIGAKRLDLLYATVPKLAHVAVLLNAANPTRDSNYKSVLGAAQRKRVKVMRVEVRTPQDIASAFATMKRQRVDAFIAQTDQFLAQQRRQIVDEAARARLPAIYGTADFVEAGGLMSYGQNRSESYRRAAVYVDKIIKGAKPADLPVEQPTKFELFFNKKTASSLGLKIPDEVLLRVDKVIE